MLDKRFGKERINKTPDVINYDYVLDAFNLQATSSYMFRRYPLDINRGFDVELPSAQEYDLALLISKKHPIISIPEVLVIQNQTKGQISEDWTRKIKGIIAIRKKHKKDYKPIHHIKAFGLIAMFMFGYIFGNRIYGILIHFKEKYSYER